MDNKRGGQRQRVLKSGKIVFAGGSFGVDCTIRDLFDGSARLRVPTSLPFFRLVHAIDSRARTHREATVVGARATSSGCAFHSSTSSSSLPIN
jgi:hypothetical protein